MQDVSRLLSRHGRLIDPTRVIVVLAATGTLVALVGAVAIFAALLLLESEPLIAAPMRW